MTFSGFPSGGFDFGCSALQCFVLGLCLFYFQWFCFIFYRFGLVFSFGFFVFFYFLFFIRIYRFFNDYDVVLGC